MKAHLLIAKYIGTPVDSNLPVTPVLAEIADKETAEVGEKVYTLVPDDSNDVDTIYTTDANGTITPVKIALGTPTELTFSHLQSKLEYVLVKEVIESPDTDAFARRKVAIQRAMDKKELKAALDLVLNVAGQEVVQESTDDIYKLIKKMVRKIEDYADNYILLCGSTAWAAISDYDKDVADTDNYNPQINKMLADEGIKKVKVVGNIKTDSGSNLAVLDASKLILVGRNSALAKGKPIVLVRRKLSPIAENAGAEVTLEERAVFVPEVPAPFYNGTTMTVGYGIFGYESFIEAILNYRATCWATYSA